jgi:D-alanyl-D-alanine carboxypeptidase
MRRRRWLLWCAVSLVVALGAVLAVDRLFFAQGTHTCDAVAGPPSSRPGLQRQLDAAVSGERPLAPGATAAVAGPNGRWTGAAGVSDLDGCMPMRPDARMRLESITKIYTATLILQLAEDGKLDVDDTVEHWLPGLLPYGDQITIRQLLTMRSGMIDSNDYTSASLAHVRDARVRSQLQATFDRAADDPTAEIAPIWWIRWAAWQPLQSLPGAEAHYSNIGYDVLGLIAARAGGEPLEALYRERIFAPLGLRATAYDPQGPIAGPHARGYGIEPDAGTFDTSDWHWGVGAGGGIVSDARDTATFLSALMRGRLLERRWVRAMQGPDLWLGAATAPCAVSAYGWSGGGSGYKTDAWVDGDGTRVAVVLLNARHLGTDQPAGDQAAGDLMARLYCAA